MLCGLQVTEMLHCFLHNARCELFHRVIDPENASKLSQFLFPHTRGSSIALT